MHEPLPIDANEVESVETVVDPRQIFPVSKRLLLQHLLILTEVLQTNIATSNQGVILLRQNFSELFVNVVDHLFFLLSLIAVLL
jgi:hypothetical protein